MTLSLYQRLIVPYLVHLSMRQERLEPHRRRVVPAATGRVLEIGVGSGLNFRFYADDAKQVVGVDPSAKLLTWRDRGGSIGWIRCGHALLGASHLARPIDRLITEAGFGIDWLDTGYMEGPKLLTFLYEGAAHPR